MKVLVIPDCHLKPEMYHKAAELMRKGCADVAVSLMDISDDWNKEFDLAAYEQTYNAVLDFAREFPQTIFCYGNHDLSYVWKEIESGYSYTAGKLARDFIDNLKKVLPADNQPSYVRRIDDILFSHGGLSDSFMIDNVPMSKWTETDEFIDLINSFGRDRIWKDNSPIWYRPQYSSRGYCGLFKPERFYQVTGHTPTAMFHEEEGYVSCDVFSTFSDGRPIGTREFMIIDTKTRDYSGIAIGSISY